MDMRPPELDRCHLDASEKGQGGQESQLSAELVRVWDRGQVRSKPTTDTRRESTGF